jgi:hypothetical protein
MDFKLPFIPVKFDKTISYNDSILFVGSCFTEHIGNRFKELKFKTLHNPNGIVYDPVSISSGLISYIENKQYTDSDLVQINELWHSWQHHGSFSDPDREYCLNRINESQRQAHSFLKKADWLFISLGSAFCYQLAENGSAVANCHKAVEKTFKKSMLTIEEIKSAFDTCIHRLFHFNPGLKIIFTVSPVRYVRDGLVANNLSKSRMIEVVQHLVTKFNRLYYFPAYELVIDVLRDYRFYDSDMVHPNGLAIQFVFENLKKSVIDVGTLALMEKVGKVITATRHKALHPGTNAHKQFIADLYDKMQSLEREYPFLKFQEEREAMGK